MTLSLDLTSHAPLSDLRPGRVPPLYVMPAHIERPEYMLCDDPERVTVFDAKDLEAIEHIRYAEKIVVQTLKLVGETVKPKATADKLNRIGHDPLIAHDICPPYLRYMGYPKPLYTSINEVVCRGIPDDRPLKGDDIINVDIAAYVKGIYGDTYRTFEVGTVGGESHLPIEHTESAMMYGIKAVTPEQEINVISHVIKKYMRYLNYDVVRDYTGRGADEAFHSGLIIPRYGAAPSYSTVMKPGIASTIEPMIILSGIDWEQRDDEWAAVTTDRSYTTRFEHTVVITEDGAKILTLL